MKKLKCLVVDDEHFARQGIIEYIEDTDFLELTAQAEDPIEAMQEINENEIDLMFLDINMPKMSGIDFLKVAKNLPATIITTAYQEYALEGFDLQVIDYLLKPIDYNRFLTAVTKAQSFLEHNIFKKTDNNTDFFYVKCNGIYEQIIIEDILVVEAMQNYVVIHSKTKKTTSLLSLKSVEDFLPASDFIKIHKSYLVAKKAIQSIGQDSVKVNNIDYTIGATFKSFLIESFLNSKIITKK